MNHPEALRDLHASMAELAAKIADEYGDGFAVDFVRKETGVGAHISRGDLLRAVRAARRKRDGLVVP